MHLTMTLSPTLVATTQAAALSGASNIAAQIIEAYQAQVSNYQGNWNTLYSAVGCKTDHKVRSIHSPLIWSSSPASYS